MERILIAQGFVACFGSSAAGQKQAIDKRVGEDLQRDGLYHIMHRSKVMNWASGMGQF